MAPKVGHLLAKGILHLISGQPQVPKTGGFGEEELHWGRHLNAGLGHPEQEENSWGDKAQP